MIDTIDAKMSTAPSRPLPVGSCDCHTHVFGPLDQFPTGKSSYAIPLSPPDIYDKYLQSTGFSRSILVQPAPYGQDTRALVNALNHFEGRMRGIAVADSQINDEKLYELNAAGVRGLRFIEKIDPRTGNPYSGSIGISELKKLFPRLQKLGWQAHVWTTGCELPRIYKELNGLDIPLVFDHMGHFDLAAGVGSLEFKTLLEMLTDERVWLKMSICRISAQPPLYEDLKPYHDILVDKFSERLVWGSDWPFVAMREKSPDVGDLLDVFCDWVQDDNLIARILAENPGKLFDFE